MDRALFSLAVLSCCSGVNFQATLTQPASVSVSLGEMAILSCLISGSSGTVSWYQQRPGQAPRFVLSGTSTRGDGIPDRFAGFTCGNISFLTIADLQAEDEADYYCGAVAHSDVTRINCDGELTQNSSFLEAGVCRP
uniref:Uncharacterized protein n=1 Tax=Sphaerodactylus townsendi TaxID=933632 RepID=A0ACB8FZS2_9SAUR